MSWSRVISSIALLALGAGVAALFFLTLDPIVPGIPEKSPADARPAGGDRSRFEAVFEAWAADPALAGASVGYCLLGEDGEPVFASPLAATALCPASALKTVTTAAALEMLGPEFRFTTAFVGDGTRWRDGIVQGDLTLAGSGDPTLSTADLEALAKSLLDRGLKQVAGRLVLRADGFPGGSPVNDHWNWGDIGNGYGAGAHGINLDRNRIAVRFRAGSREGDPAVLLNPEPPAADARWNNEVLTGPPGSGDRVVAYSEPFGRVVALRGTVPLGASDFSISAALPDPPAKARELLEAVLQDVRFLGEAAQPGSTPAVLASHSSAALPEIIDHLHRVSDNLEAQCLFLKIGANANDDPARVVRRHWENRGVEFKGLRMIDGSGLARANMIRPLDLAKVNHLARRGPHGDRFRQSLTAYLDGKVRSKLGAMSGVKTDVGFITMPDGGEFTFCLMANGLDPGLSFWPLRDALLQETAAR